MQLQNNTEYNYCSYSHNPTRQKYINTKTIKNVDNDSDDSEYDETDDNIIIDDNECQIYLVFTKRIINMYLNYMNMDISPLNRNCFNLFDKFLHYYYDVFKDDNMQIYYQEKEYNLMILKCYSLYKEYLSYLHTLCDYKKMSKSYLYYAMLIIYWLFIKIEDDDNFYRPDLVKIIETLKKKYTDYDNYFNDNYVNYRFRDENEYREYKETNSINKRNDLKTRILHNKTQKFLKHIDYNIYGIYKKYNLINCIDYNISQY